MPIERKLAAIMFTDIAGYKSRCLKMKIKLLLLFKKRELLLPLVEKYEGKLIKEIGDKLGVQISLNNIGIVLALIKVSMTRH